MQAVLISAVRGCDGAPKNDPSKPILWALRWDTINPSDESFDPNTTTSFMGYTVDLKVAVRQFLGSMDPYPLHFVTHLLHAAEICGYFHPDEKIRGFWQSFYNRACSALHMNPETQAELVHRLRDR
jgi:hypothetical protein